MKKTIEYKHPNTVWEQIKWEIELLIINGTLKSTDKVPSISELAEKYGIGKTTAKKALDALFEEGTIAKHMGIGFFVNPYTKEKLKEDHMNNLKSSLEKDIAFAKELNVDVRTLEVIFKRKTETVYSR